jgi:FkbM family methyltransferase
MSYGELVSALAEAGKHAQTRDAFLIFLKQMETEFPDKSINVREVVTGPIVDALFKKNELLEKEISGGLKLAFRYTSKIARDFVLAGDKPDHVWEPQTTKLVMKLSEGAAHVVITGAYFGDHAVLVANQLKQNGGKCHCFELNAGSVELLKRNAQANRLDNLVANAIGLWSHEARLSLYGDDSHAAPQEVAGSEGVPGTTLDRYGKEQGIGKLQMWMLDIEGGELNALKGGESYLRKAPGDAPHIIFEIHRAYSDWSNGLENTDIAKYLSGLGYKMFAIRDYQGNVPMPGKPIELVPIETAYIEGPPHGFNILAVKNERVLDAPDFRIVRNVSPKLLFHRDAKLHQPLS